MRQPLDETAFQTLATQCPLGAFLVMHWQFMNMILTNVDIVDDETKCSEDQTPSGTSAAEENV